MSKLWLLKEEEYKSTRNVAVFNSLETAKKYAFDTYYFPRDDEDESSWLSVGWEIDDSNLCIERWDLGSMHLVLEPIEYFK